MANTKLASESIDIYMGSMLQSNEPYSSVSLLVSGFPVGSKISKVENFMQKICGGRNYCIKMTNSQQFKGFTFINFDTLDQAKEFSTQPLFFNAKQLNLRVTSSHQEFVKESLQNIRSPKKIIVDRIPKRITKEFLETFFAKFGEIEHMNLVDRDEKTVNFAYVTFYESSSAKAAVDCKNL